MSEQQLNVGHASVRGALKDQVDRVPTWDDFQELSKEIVDEVYGKNHKSDVLKIR